MPLACAVVLLLAGGPRTSQGETPELFRKEAFTRATFAEAVNYFAGMGEDRALKELNRVASARGNYSGRITWVCRVLFDPKGKEPLREPAFGWDEDRPNGMSMRDWPRYPVVVSGSSCFVFNQSYTIFGYPEPLHDYVDYCRQAGVFRKTLLPVPTREQSIKDENALQKTWAWKYLKWFDKEGPYPEMLGTIKEQAEGIK